MQETVLDLVRGDDNVYNIDVTGDLDSGDQVWFRAARRTAELTDADALILKGRNVAGLTGIADIDLPTAVIQVQLDPADTASLTDRALMYHVQLFKADVSKLTTVSKGILRIAG